MAELRIRDIMTRSFIQADAGLLQELQKQPDNKDWEAVIFRERSGKVKGIVGKGQLRGTAGHCMDLAEPFILSEEDEIDKAISLLQQGRGGILVTDGAGNITGVITPEALVKQLFAGWKKSQANLETLLKYASEAICIINDREEVEYWNPRAEVLYGIREKEILGRPIGKFFTNLMVTQSLRDGKVFKELYHQPREGAHVLITAVPIPAGERVIGSMSLERDIAAIVYFNEELSKTSVKVGQLKKEISRLSKKDAFSRIYGHSTVEWRRFISNAGL